MLFQELSKLKRSSIMTSIVMMSVGILMIMCPAQYVGSLVSVLGYGLVICAAVMVLDFISSKRVLMNFIYLTGALLMALAGIAVLVDDNIVRGIGAVFGVILLADGIFGIFTTLLYVKRSRRKSWWVLIVLCALMVLFGLIVLVNPWWSEPLMLFDVVGGMLLFSSMVSIVRLVYIWPIKSE